MTCQGSKPSKKGEEKRKTPKPKKNASLGWEIHKLHANEKLYLLKRPHRNEGSGEKKEKGKKEYSESVVTHRRQTDLS